MQALEQFVAAGLLTAGAPPPPDDDGVASGAAAGATRPRVSGMCHNGICLQSFFTFPPFFVFFGVPLIALATARRPRISWTSVSV